MYCVFHILIIQSIEKKCKRKIIKVNICPYYTNASALKNSKISGIIIKAERILSRTGEILTLYDAKLIKSLYDPYTARE